MVERIWSVICLDSARAFAIQIPGYKFLPITLFQGLPFKAMLLSPSISGCVCCQASCLVSVWSVLSFPTLKPRLVIIDDSQKGDFKWAKPIKTLFVGWTLGPKLPRGIPNITGRPITSVHQVANGPSTKNLRSI